MGSVQLASREAKIRAPVRANSIADLASFSAPSVNKLCREAGGKALLSANSKALLTSLAGKALHNRAKFTSKGRTKAVASSCEVTLSGEVLLALPIAKRKALLGLRLLSPRGLISNLLESL